MDPGDGPKINATAVSFRILDRIKDHDGMTMTEIVEAIDKPTSTVHDHLQTLTDLGYLVREDDEYVLGMKLLELGGYARTRSRLCRIAESEIQNLALDVGDHANLMVEENGSACSSSSARGTRRSRWIPSRASAFTSTLPRWGSRCWPTWTTSGSTVSSRSTDSRR
ncbi:helix-turn-helix domain-containing protein [Halosimplex aquaticum]